VGSDRGEAIALTGVFAVFTKFAISPVKSDVELEGRFVPALDRAHLRDIAMDDEDLTREALLDWTRRCAIATASIAFAWRSTQRAPAPTWAQARLRPLSG
jgi:hypothetical protein